MAILLDTHILLWALYEPTLLSNECRTRLEDSDSQIWFSAASIWEIAIKQSLGRSDFTASPYDVRTEAIHLGFQELQIDGLHASQITSLPPLHADPFDRLLVAQAQATGLTLWSRDNWVIQYPGPIEAV